MTAFLPYQPIPVSVLAVEDISDGEARIGGSFRGTLKNSSSTGQQLLLVHIVACPPYLRLGLVCIYYNTVCIGLSRCPTMPDTDRPYRKQLKEAETMYCNIMPSNKASI